MIEHDQASENGDAARAALDIRLTRAMLANLRNIARVIPPRTRFTQMLAQHGAVGAWDRVKRTDTSGFTALYLNELLHLSFEALVVENAEYHRLFSADDMAEMRRLLREHGYQSGGSNRSDGVT